MGERWGKMGKKWVKNEITGLQKTALMHASAGLEDSSPYFQYLDCWLQNEVAAVEKIRQRVAPETGV